MKSDTEQQKENLDMKRTSLTSNTKKSHFKKTELSQGLSNSTKNYTKAN